MGKQSNCPLRIVDCRFNITPFKQRRQLTMRIFYDTHAHLDYPDYAPDLAAVIERAAAAGIGKIIAIGTDLESSARAVKLSERFPNVYAAVGWHPSQASDAPEDLPPALRELARHPKVVGIGETGLDYYRLPSAQGGTPADDQRHKQKQSALFRQHLELASDRFMLETDCPYLAPVPYRGKRCEPAYVKEIAEIAAHLKDSSPEELSGATCATAHQFFPKLA